MISWVRNDQISTPFYTSPKVVLPRKPPYETPWLTTNPMDLPSIKYSLRTFASVRASLAGKPFVSRGFSPVSSRFGSVNGPAAAIDFGVGFNQETCLAEASCWESSPRALKKRKASWHLRGQLCKKSWAFFIFFGREVLGGRENTLGSRKQTKHSENICFKIDVRFFSPG